MKYSGRKSARFSLSALIKAVCNILAFGLLFALLLSVFASGYGYQFDIDEFFFSQYSYLYAHGLRPYIDVYTSVYPPLFAWVITPAFWLKGFSFAGMHVARIFMIGLLLIRIISLWNTLKIIFSKRTATLFLPLFLFDPFAVFTTMQIRPDNLMLTLFSLGLYFFVKGFVYSQKKALILAGILFSVSVITLPKILPTVGIISLLFVLYQVIKRKFSDIFPFVFAGLVPALVFGVYLQLQGSLQEMMLQTFVDIKLLYTTFSVPIPIGSMMRPDNLYVFGTPGKPITWAYVLLIAPIGLAGAFHVIYDLLKKGIDKPAETVKVMLVLSFVAQWSILFMLQVVFLQHYMLFHWLAAALFAAAIDDVLSVSEKFKFIHAAIMLIVILSFSALSIDSISHNISRSTITSVNQGQEKFYESKWKQIDPNEAVFPGFLFRPSTYPLPYGGVLVTFPITVSDRLPDMVTMLRTKNPKVLLDEYTLTHLPDSTQAYIRDQYQRDPIDSEFMVRK